MKLISANIKWIMLISGALTCSMAYAAIAPQAALEATFGENLSGPVAEVVVRNWGVLITLMGAMLIYGAFNPPVRAFALIIAGVSKLAFAGLILAQGSRFLSHQAGGAVAIDLAWVVLFAAYLAGSAARSKTA
jgi:hypothetical protein